MANSLDAWLEEFRKSLEKQNKSQSDFFHFKKTMQMDNSLRISLAAGVSDMDLLSRYHCAACSRRDSGFGTLDCLRRLLCDLEICCG